jgi:CBS domain-containing protein
MFKSRTLGERTRDTVQESLGIGREAMGRAVERGQEVLGRGQQAISRMRRPEPASRSNGWIWFAGGLAAGLAALVGWRRAGAAGMLPWMGRTVDEVMVRNVQTIEASTNLTQAAQRMRDANIGVLPVVDGGRLKGIVTDRDLVIRGMATGVDPTTMRVSDVATHSLIAARPDWTVQHAMDTMASHQIGRLPVIDEQDRVCGMVTLSSLALRSRQQSETLDAAKEVSRRSARAV